MRSTLILSALFTSLAAASTPFQVSNYMSDIIGDYKYYTFDLTYTPPATHSSNIPLSEPAFNTTHCQYSTDDATNYVMCEDKSIKTIGDFSNGENMKLTVVHSWTVVATGASAAKPAKPAKEYARTANKTVQLYLGSAGQPASFQVTGGSEVLTPAVKSSTRRSEGKARRDSIVV